MSQYSRRDDAHSRERLLRSHQTALALESTVETGCECESRKIESATTDIDVGLADKLNAGLRDLYSDMPGYGVTSEELEDLLAGRYGAQGPGDDRSQAELILATLLVGVAHEYTDIDPDEHGRAIAHLITNRCQNKPWTDAGDPRKWAEAGPDYREHIVGTAIANFNSRIFKLWKLKTDSNDYSYLTYKFVLEAVHEFARDDAGYPTSNEVVARAALLDIMDDGGCRSVRTYRNALSELVNRHEQIQRAKVEGKNSSLYYPVRSADPPNAEYVVCGERREPASTEAHAKTHT